MQFRLIQEEKMTTEQRAEELESRVGSVEHMNLLLQQSTGSSSSHQGGHSSGQHHHNSFSSVGGNSDLQRGSSGAAPLGVPPQPPPRSGRPSAAVPPFDHGSPTQSGRSTPKAHHMGLVPQGGNLQDPYMQKYHTVRSQKSDIFKKEPRKFTLTRSNFARVNF